MFFYDKKYFKTALSIHFTLSYNFLKRYMSEKIIRFNNKLCNFILKNIVKIIVSKLLF